ncbi:hypothetical protein [Sorangium sp. So ce1153]|uniref:hypothetical protein n=1 Tax=Sorangium sp. So ce1153 TaxID=3133333 RepID=UPI003F5E48EB
MRVRLILENGGHALSKVVELPEAPGGKRPSQQLRRLERIMDHEHWTRSRTASQSQKGWGITR